MTTRHVAVTPKPHLIGSLRSTWRGTSEHYLAQLKRFAVVFLGALLPQIIATGWDNLGLDSLKALAPAALLVAIKQVWPELGAAAVDSAPGATIVPAEVAGDAAP